MSHRSFFITLSSSDCAKHLTGVPDKVYKKGSHLCFLVTMGDKRCLKLSILLEYTSREIEAKNLEKQM